MYLSRRDQFLWELASKSVGSKEPKPSKQSETKNHVDTKPATSRQGRHVLQHPKENQQFLDRGRHREAGKPLHCPHSEPLGVVHLLQRKEMQA